MTLKPLLFIIPSFILEGLPFAGLLSGLGPIALPDSLNRVFSGRAFSDYSFSFEEVEPDVFEALDDELGTTDEPVIDDGGMVFVWVTTPIGVVPLLFTPIQWKMITETATVARTSPEEVIIDIAKYRYGLD